jgi:hypothetical protein
MKSYTSTDMLHADMLIALQAEIDKSNYSSFVKRRMKAALYRRRIQRLLFDKILTEAVEDEAMFVSQDGDIVTFTVDWEAILNILIKLLPLLLMFL